MVLQCNKDFGIVLKEDVDTEILASGTSPISRGLVIPLDATIVLMRKKYIFNKTLELFEREYDLVVKKGYLPKLIVEVVAHPVIMSYGLLGYSITDIISVYLIKTYLIFSKQGQEIMRLNTSETFSYNLAVQIRKIADKEELVNVKCTLLKYEDGKLLFNQLKDYEL